MSRRERPVRRDAQATRRTLLTAASRLIAERGSTFGLSDLARAADVSTATVYRHFADVSELLTEYQAGLVDGLAEALGAVPRDQPPLDRLQDMGIAWVEMVAGWGRAAARLRSAHGVLERIRNDDPSMNQLHRTLAPIVRELIGDGLIRDQEVDLAVLLWLAIFDERLVLELLEDLHMSREQCAGELTRAVIGALGGDPHTLATT